MMKDACGIFDAFEHHGVRLDGLFFKVANKAMTEFWVSEVGNEKRVHENALKGNDHGSFNEAGFS